MTRVYIKAKNLFKTTKLQKVTSYQNLKVTYCFGIKFGKRIEILQFSVFPHIVRLRIGHSSIEQGEELTSKTSVFSNSLWNLFFSYCLQPDWILVPTRLTLAFPQKNEHPLEISWKPKSLWKIGKTVKQMQLYWHQNRPQIDTLTNFQKVGKNAKNSFDKFETLQNMDPTVNLLRLLWTFVPIGLHFSACW